MKKKLSTAILAIFLLSGCFRVGRLPATTPSGPGYDDPRSAIVVPTGEGAAVLVVNGESVQTEFLDRLANLTLNLLLMYLEPQVYVKPGQNNMIVRGSHSDTVNYGSYSVTTTRWRDYTLGLYAAVGERYILQADVDRGTSLTLDTSEKSPTATLASNDVPAPAPEPAKPAGKQSAKSSNKSAKAKKAK